MGKGDFHSLHHMPSSHAAGGCGLRGEQLFPPKIPSQRQGGGGLPHFPPTAHWAGP